jgi:16S rRNA (cytidine1402-2'-O)-methyltransferase
VAALQDYPAGALYPVATPIGNLADVSLRTLHLLSLVDGIACEDTRHSQQLLRAWGLETSKLQWLALHQHNEAQASEQVLDLLRQGHRVAYLSDAGAPCISDPGTRLVRMTLQAGLRVVPLPGPSSVTTVLSASGAWQSDRSDFVFQGFLPSKGQERSRRLHDMVHDPRPQCWLEAPHRIETLANELSRLPSRGLTVGRELTKQFEELACIDTHSLGAWLHQKSHRLKGEYALVLHEAAEAPPGQAKGLKELQALMPHLPLKTAVQVAAELSGGSRNDLYALALQWQSVR